MVVLPPGTTPSWEPVRDFFAAKGFPLRLMMIDGALSFPDEAPPEAWGEVRVGTPSGMVTLRREVDGIRLVTWGNAEKPLVQMWNALAWGLAKVHGGTIGQDGTPVSAADFAKQADLPKGMAD